MATNTFKWAGKNDCDCCCLESIFGYFNPIPTQAQMLFTTAPGSTSDKELRMGGTDPRGDYVYGPHWPGHTAGVDHWTLDEIYGADDCPSNLVGDRLIASCAIPYCSGITNPALIKCCIVYRYIDSATYHVHRKYRGLVIPSPSPPDDVWSDFDENVVVFGMSAAVVFTKMTNDDIYLSAIHSLNRTGGVAAVGSVLIGSGSVDPTGSWAVPVGANGLRPWPDADAEPYQSNQCEWVLDGSCFSGGGGSVSVSLIP